MYVPHHGTYKGMNEDLFFIFWSAILVIWSGSLFICSACLWKLAKDLEYERAADAYCRRRELNRSSRERM
jgi:hypothetical protein